MTASAARRAAPPDTTQPAAPEPAAQEAAREPAAARPAALGGGDPFAPRRLVVFDLDGTLYDQRRLRRRMMRLLLAEALRRRRLTEIRVLSAYRARREALAEAEVHDFEPRLIAETAAASRQPEALVREIVADWIDARPLPLLRGCMVAGTAAFFARLRGAGVAIGVLSDYPVGAKLAAMGLKADHAVAATDPGVLVQKPSPRGLEHLLARAGCRPDEALMIGDRMERDGAIAARLGTAFLLRGRSPGPGTAAVADFTDRRLAGLAA